MAQMGFVWFLRLVSIYCLVAGVGYWAQLSGYYEGMLWRFDLMPWQWKVASVSLAMLYPVASTGLWMMVSWGPVIWFVAALGETLMFTVFSNYFLLQTTDRHRAWLRGFSLYLLPRRTFSAETPAGKAGAIEQSQEKWAPVFRPVLRQAMSKARKSGHRFSVRFCGRR